MTQIAIEHVDYPHEPGRLHDCPACEAQCHCGPGVAAGTETECVWPPHEEEKTCVHCGATVRLAAVPRGDGQTAWSDGHPRYPFFCPHSISLTHSVLDRKA